MIWPCYDSYDPTKDLIIKVYRLIFKVQGIEKN